MKYRQPSSPPYFIVFTRCSSLSFFFYFFFTSSNNALSLSFLHSCYRIFVFKIYRNYLKYWDEARGKLVKIYIGLSSLYIYDRPCESLCTLSWKEDRNEIMLDKIFINFSTSKTSRLFFDFLSSLTRGAKKIQKIFDCIIRGSYFIRKMRETYILRFRDLILIVRFERYTWQRRIQRGEERRIDLDRVRSNLLAR